MELTREIGDQKVGSIGLGLMSLSGMNRGDKIGSDEERFAVCGFYVHFSIKLLLKGVTSGTPQIFMVTRRTYLDDGKRDQVFLATKFGCSLVKPQEMVNPEKPFRLINGDPEYVKEAFERSIKRLGIDKIDLYYLHRADPTVPIERTVKAMSELVKEGKVRYLGVSEASASTLKRAHSIHPITAVQVEYSPFVLEIEGEKIGLLKACRELGVKIVCYSPLGKGLLTGNFRSVDDFAKDDWRRSIPKFSEENFPKLVKLADGLKAIGDRHGGSSASQVSLAWVLGQGDDIIAIPGTNKIKHLEQNIAASKLILSPEELAEVRKYAEEADAIQGSRYPPEIAEMFFFVDTPAL